MRANKIFLASADIARRAGVIGSSFRTADGRFVVNEHDLKGLVLKPEEYVGGIAVEEISRGKAKTLIAANSHQIGEVKQAEVSKNSSEPIKEQEESK